MNLSLLSTRWFDYRSSEYYQSLALRNQVLRKPINLQFSKEQLAPDKRDWHLGVFFQSECIACLIISPMSDLNVAKMRQVAVSEKYQGQGIGKIMVIEAERLLKSRNFNEISLHARENAIPFYLTLGYTLVGDWFTEVGIPHKKMIKPL
jgi:predicted GNAT family N-acyltransferase